MKVRHVEAFLAAWILAEVLGWVIGGIALVVTATLALLAIESTISWHRDEDPRPYLGNLLAAVLGAVFSAYVPYAGWVLLALWAFWVAYIFLMGLYRAYLQERLRGLTLIMAAPFVALAFALDFVMQMTVFTVIFLDPPRHMLVTNRLRAYMLGPVNWRRRLAERLCNELLDAFDPTGAHCD